MPDRRDVPFRTKSMGPSSGQTFRRFGAASRGDLTASQFNAAAADIDAMTMRFRVETRMLAERTLETLRSNVIKYIEPRTGDFHGFSTGRLAATIGTWDPSKFVPSESGQDAQSKAEQWATDNGVASYMQDTNDELTIIENGAYSSVKRYRGDTWTVEMGTYTPYAGLVEDGGSMPIASYGNESKTILAHWEANHMFKKGTFDSYKDIEDDMSATVKKIITE